MYSFLTEMWCSYIIEHPYESNSEKPKQLNDILAKEEKLRETLSAEQTTLFLQYYDSISQYQMTEEQDAFINGVLFASAFLQILSRALGKNRFVDIDICGNLWYNRFDRYIELPVLRKEITDEKTYSDTMHHCWCSFAFTADSGNCFCTDHANRLSRCGHRSGAGCVSKWNGRCPSIPVPTPPRRRRRHPGARGSRAPPYW